MRTALLTATALVALSSLALAQDQLATGTPSAPKANAVTDPAMPSMPASDRNAPGAGRLHYDVPCRVSSAGTCITEPPRYPPYRPRP